MLESVVFNALINYVLEKAKVGMRKPHECVWIEIAEILRNFLQTFTLISSLRNR